LPRGRKGKDGTAWMHGDWADREGVGDEEGGRWEQPLDISITKSAWPCWREKDAREKRTKTSLI